MSPMSANIFNSFTLNYPSENLVLAEIVFGVAQFLEFKTVIPSKNN